MNRIAVALFPFLIFAACGPEDAPQWLVFEVHGDTDRVLIDREIELGLQADGCFGGWEAFEIRSEGGEVLAREALDDSELDEVGRHVTLPADAFDFDVEELPLTVALEATVICSSGATASETLPPFEFVPVSLAYEAPADTQWPDMHGFYWTTESGDVLVCDPDGILRLHSDGEVSQGEPISVSCPGTPGQPGALLRDHAPYIVSSPAGVVALNEALEILWQDEAAGNEKVSVSGDHVFVLEEGGLMDPSTITAHDVQTGDVVGTMTIDSPQLPASEPVVLADGDFAIVSARITLSPPTLRFFLVTMDPSDPGTQESRLVHEVTAPDGEPLSANVDAARIFPDEDRIVVLHPPAEGDGTVASAYRLDTLELVDQTSFDVSPSILAIDASGIWVQAGTELLRLNYDGQFDLSWFAPGEALSVVALASEFGALVNVEEESLVILDDALEEVWSFPWTTPVGAAFDGNGRLLFTLDDRRLAVLPTLGD